MNSKISLYTLLTLTTLGSSVSWGQGGPPKPPASKPAKPEPPKENALEGELRLDGKITVMLGTGNWVIEAVSWTSPKGVTTNFDDPKSKTVFINADAFLHPRGELDKVAVADVKIGDRVAVIGKNQPDGTVKVREVVLLEGYGARKKVGSFTTNVETLRLINQSRAARDAGQIERAIELAKRGVEAAQGIGDGSGEALATQDLATLYLSNGQLDLALQYASREEALGKALSNSLAIIFGKLGRARILAATDQVAEAIQILQEAIPVSQSVPVTLQLDVLDELAQCYIAAKEYSDAIGVMEKLHPLEAANNKVDESYLTRLTISLLLADEEPDEARNRLNQVASNIPNIRDDAKRAYGFGITGIVLWRLGEKEESTQQLQKASQTLKDAGLKGAERWEAVAKKLAESGDKKGDALDALKEEQTTA